ncbi:MAG: hypothetical protein ACLQDQ_19325 [Myxococcaceae bacterium]
MEDPDSQAGLAAESVARAQAQRALDELSQVRTPGWLRTGLDGTLGVPVLWGGLALGIAGLLLALFRRSPVGGWVLLVAAAALLLAAWRRAT